MYVVVLQHRQSLIMCLFPMCCSMWDWNVAHWQSCACCSMQFDNDCICMLQHASGIGPYISMLQHAISHTSDIGPCISMLQHAI